MGASGEHRLLTPAVDVWGILATGAPVHRARVSLSYIALQATYAAGGPAGVVSYCLPAVRDAGGELLPLRLARAARLPAVRNVDQLIRAALPLVVSARRHWRRCHKWQRLL